MILFLISAAILGLIIGSFINAAVPRLHARDGSFLTGRSQCPLCRNELSIADLIPVVSYVFLRGRCRYCGKPFGARYLFVELITAATFALVTAVLGLGDLAFLAWALVITAVLLFIATYDWLYTEIPDAVALPAIVFTLAVSPFAFTPPSIVNAFVGALIIGLGFAALVIFSAGKWMGGGDIRLGALLGALLGWQSALVAVFLAALIGTLGGTIFAVVKFHTVRLTREQLLKTQIPFGPALVAGGVIALLCGQQLVTWYLTTFLIG